MIFTGNSTKDSHFNRASRLSPLTTIMRLPGGPSSSSYSMDIPGKKFA